MEVRLDALKGGALHGAYKKRGWGSHGAKKLFEGGAFYVEPKSERGSSWQARKHAPCIVFIDEIDAVGSKRSNRDNTAVRSEGEGSGGVARGFLWSILPRDVGTFTHFLPT